MYGKKKTKTFRVIVVDSRPLLEGRDLLEKLLDAGIDCTYIFLNSLSYVMTKEVSPKYSWELLHLCRMGRLCPE